MPQSKNYQGLSQSNGFPGVSQSKGLQQNDCQGVPKSKEMSGGNKIKMTARVYHKNTREYHNQNVSQGV